MTSITRSVADVFSRPADSNFDSIDDLLAVAKEEMDQSRQVRVNGADISFSASDGRFYIDTPRELPLPLTNYSMTQVAQMAKIDRKMLERLHNKDRDDLVVDNLITLFPNDRSKSKFILIRDHFDDAIKIDSVARAVNGGIYGRLWDHTLFGEMEDLLVTRGFKPMLPTSTGNRIVNRSGFMHGLTTGLFRGDQCSFGFFTTEEDLAGRGIGDRTLGGLRPGVMVWNSEVGARSFGYHLFYYHETSGSIIVWTPSHHKRKRWVHRGDVMKSFREYTGVLEDVAVNFPQRYVDDLDTFGTAANTQFAVDEDAARDRLNKHFKMPVANARAVVKAAKLPQNNYGFPLSVWNIALGIAWEAGQTGRAQSLVDDTLVATKMMRSILKV